MTYLELQNSVADHLNRSDLSAIIPTWIRWAIKMIERKANFNYMRVSTTTLTITIGDRDIPMPDRYKRRRYFYIIIDSAAYFLDWVNEEEIDSYDRDVGSQNQTPSRYAKQGTNFVLDYKPESSYSHKFSFYQYSAELVDDGDTNWLTENADDLIVHIALSFSAPYLGKDLRLATWASIAKAVYRDLIKAEAETPGQVKLEVARVTRRTHNYDISTDRLRS